MSNFNVGKILEELQDMHKKLGEHIISDMDCLSYDDDNAEFDEAMLLNTLQKIETRIEQSIKEVEGDTGYTLAYCEKLRKKVEALA